MIASSDRIKLACLGMTKRAEDPNWLQRMLLNVGAGPPPEPPKKPYDNMAIGGAAGLGVGAAGWSASELGFKRPALHKYMSALNDFNNLTPGDINPLTTNHVDLLNLLLRDGKRHQVMTPQDLAIKLVDAVGIKNDINKAHPDNPLTQGFNKALDLNTRLDSIGRLQSRFAKFGLPALLAAGALGGYAHHRANNA